jgi:hypothetical protein
MTPIDPLSPAEIDRAIARAHVERSRFVHDLLARLGSRLHLHG